MRLRSLVLPAVLAFGAAVVAPTPAQAAVECGVTMPAKVVINAPRVETAMTLSDGCYLNEADHANWDVWHPRSGFGYSNDFSADDLAQGPDWVWPWDDHEPMGQWVLDPAGAAQADGDPLTQNEAVILVKYAARLSASVTRTSTRLTLGATATRWSGVSHKYVARGGVTVRLYHQTKTGATWTYVKAATTSSTGKATVSVTSPKAGNYRLVIAETSTVWAARSTTVKGRV